jgi:hypothetical protein
MKKNALKYPVEKTRGSNKKYNKLWVSGAFLFPKAIIQEFYILYCGPVYVWYFFRWDLVRC